jgi:hypothetical protein
MIDIYSLENKDLTFKKYQGLKIESLLKPQKTYKYWEKVGFDVFFWIHQNISFSLETFSKYLNQYLNGYGCSLQSLECSLLGKGILTLNINIFANNEEVKSAV